MSFGRPEGAKKEGVPSMRFQSIGKFLILSVIAMGFGLSAPAMATDDDTDFDDQVEAADAAAGEAQFRRCASCHTANDGGANRVGPNLWGIVDRQVGSAEGARYSRAMAGSTDVWTLENLNAFLENPRAARPGTSMSFPGLRNEGDRMNLLAYLSTLQSGHSEHMDHDMDDHSGH